eukprot:4955947-Amphidinium_carterae.1
MGFSGGGHLRKDTYPGDQINQRLDDATSADPITYLPESYDDTCERMPSIFVEQCEQAARAARYPTIQGSKLHVTKPTRCQAEGSEFGVCPLEYGINDRDDELCRWRLCDLIHLYAPSSIGIADDETRSKQQVRAVPRARSISARSPADETAHVTSSIKALERITNHTVATREADTSTKVLHGLEEEKLSSPMRPPWFLKHFRGAKVMNIGERKDKWYKDWDNGEAHRKDCHSKHAMANMVAIRMERSGTHDERGLGWTLQYYDTQPAALRRWKMGADEQAPTRMEHERAPEDAPLTYNPGKQCHYVIAAETQQGEPPDSEPLTVQKTEKKKAADIISHKNRIDAQTQCSLRLNRAASIFRGGANRDGHPSFTGGGGGAPPNDAAQIAHIRSIDHRYTVNQARMLLSSNRVSRTASSGNRWTLKTAIEAEQQRLRVWPNSRTAAGPHRNAAKRGEKELAQISLQDDQITVRGQPVPVRASLRQDCPGVQL